jgi:hypothetical protein
MVEAKEDEAAVQAAELERQRAEQEAAEVQRKADEEAAALAAAAAAVQPIGKDANAEFWKSLLGDKYTEEVVQQVGRAGLPDCPLPAGGRCLLGCLGLPELAGVVEL